MDGRVFSNTAPTIMPRTFAFVLCLALALWASTSRAEGQLQISYDCQRDDALSMLLEQAHWRVSGKVLPLSPVAASSISEPEGEAICSVALALPENAAGAEFFLPQLGAIVADDYPFAGLATFYNSVAALRLDPDGELAFSAELATNGELLAGEWIGWKGRFEVALVSAPAATVSNSGEGYLLRFADSSPSISIFVGVPRNLLAEGPGQDFSGVRYAHLWGWLAALCRVVEWSLIALFGMVGNWGLAICLLALLVRVLLLPVGILTLRWQNEVSKHQAVLAPQLAEIKANYDGEEAHNRIMAAHKALGITPFFTLKPLFASLIQIPILIAVFNALGEMPQLRGAACLWIENLSYPDAVGTLPFAIPMLGNTLNLLPFVMTAVSLLATLLHRNPHAPEAEIRRQRRNLYLMSAAFFLLFYPFPAGMVLYWTLANGLQLVQQPLVQAWTERGTGRET